MKESFSEKGAGPGPARDSKSIWSVLGSLSVEPAGLLIICSAVMCHLNFQNLLMETACRVDKGYAPEDCAEIINNVNVSFKAEEREIQKVVAGVSAITSVLFGAITVLVVLFVGPWSDANGRKVPILLSALGIVSFPIMMLFHTLVLSSTNLNALGLTFLVVLPITLTGGGAVFGMSAYSYVADTTKAKSRTVRTGLLSAAIRSGTPIGFALGGGLLKLGVKTSHSLLIALGLDAVAILILLLRVKNIIPAKTAEETKRDADREERSVWIKYNPLIKLWEVLAILFKKRKDKHVFMLLILTHMCYAAPGMGEYSMMYLFVRERLEWNIKDYGFFSIYNWFMSAAGVVLSMFILSKLLRISDPVVGFVAGLSQIGGSTLYAFTRSAAMMYLASTTDLMNGTIGVVVRSMLSKTVAPNEIGKLFALLGVLESLLPIVMVPIYAMTYRSTVTTFAGGFFLLSALVTLPAEAVFLYLIWTRQGGNSTDPPGSSIKGKTSDSEAAEIRIEESFKLMGPLESGAETEIGLIQRKMDLEE